MALTSINDILHRIRVVLYKNNFPHVKGSYIAHTQNEKTLSIEDVCTSMKNRGGYGGSVKSVIEIVKHYHDELAFLLCDGFAVHNGYFSVHPNIGGTFESASDTYDRKKNPITFRFRTRKKLRDLADRIEVVIDGIASTGAIEKFYDYDQKSTNEIFVPGDHFCITGDKIKIAGNDTSCGLFLVPVENPNNAVQITRIGENTASRITGILPASTGHAKNRIQIRTQFSGSNTLLKTPRIITSDFILEEH